jgi:hypothetical protein
VIHFGITSPDIPDVCAFSDLFERAWTSELDVLLGKSLVGGWPSVVVQIKSKFPAAATAAAGFLQLLNLPSNQ